eukprot:3400445-Prymnesium_polylepis.1
MCAARQDPQLGRLARVVRMGIDKGWDWDSLGFEALLDDKVTVWVACIVVVCCAAACVPWRQSVRAAPHAPAAACLAAVLAHTARYVLAGS